MRYLSVWRVDTDVHSGGLDFIRRGPHGSGTGSISVGYVRKGTLRSEGTDDTGALFLVQAGSMTDIHDEIPLRLES
jgi:hypothetical protein